MTGPLAAAWAAYRERVMSADAGVDEVVGTQRAFYAGAATLYGALVRGVSGGDEPSEADYRLMESVDAELRAFLGAQKQRADALRSPSAPHAGELRQALAPAPGITTLSLPFTMPAGAVVAACALVYTQATGPEQRLNDEVSAVPMVGHVAVWKADRAVTDSTLLLYLRKLEQAIAKAAESLQQPGGVQP